MKLNLTSEQERMLRLTKNPRYTCQYFEECSVNTCLLDIFVQGKRIDPSDPYKTCQLKEQHRKSYIRKLKQRVLGYVHETHQTINEQEVKTKCGEVNE